APVKLIHGPSLQRAWIHICRSEVEPCDSPWVHGHILRASTYERGARRVDPTGRRATTEKIGEPDLAAGHHGPIPVHILRVAELVLALQVERRLVCRVEWHLHPPWVRVRQREDRPLRFGAGRESAPLRDNIDVASSQRRRPTRSTAAVAPLGPYA